MNDERIYELLVKQMQGGITEEESAELQSYTNARPQLKEEMESVKAAWRATESYQNNIEINVDAAWDKVRRKIHLVQQPKVVPMNRFRIWALAASLLLILGIGYVMYQMNREPKWNNVATANETKKVQLPDGSVIWLNSNSELAYKDKFGDNRDVKLTGEAFFEVAKDPEHPFTIASGGTVTQVLGTSFNVRAYTAENKVEVSVATGRVSFAEAGTEHKEILLPGDMGSYDKTTKALNKLKVDNNYLSWKTGVLVFDNTPVPLLLKDMGHYYHASFTIKDTAVASIAFTGKLDKQPLTPALDILKSSLGMRIIRDSAQSYSIYAH
ncbi:MAG: hypothetical protein JWO03_1516 [Bacteroidetes bacterium]|nr:hypothetical protein [Bacteroidota bacterium]